MTKHAPGPWKHNEEIGANAEKGIAPYVAFHSIRDADGICLASTWTGPNEANARLISAAPDLLEALEALVKVADGNPFMPVGQFVEHGFPGLRAAIAKATGGAA